MRYVSIVVLLVGLAFAADNDGSDPTAPAVPVHFGGSDDITVTVLNSFQITFAAHVLGMDYIEGDEIIVFNSNSDNKLFMCDPDDGTYVSELPLSYASNPSPFGNCWDVGAGVTAWVNDWSSSSMAVWDGSNWSSISNPAGTSGRGMEFDGTNIWETYSSSSIMMFEPGGSPSSFPVSVGDQMSGLAVFPMESNVGVAVTTYDVHTLYFYEYDGSSLTVLGSAPCPTPVSSSLGLAYSESRDTFFWSYSSGGGYHIAELDIDLGLALTPATWGVIKTSF